MTEADLVYGLGKALTGALEKWMVEHDGWGGEMVVRVIMEVAGIAAAQAPDDVRDAVVEAAIEQFTQAVSRRTLKVH